MISAALWVLLAFCSVLPAQLSQGGDEEERVRLAAALEVLGERPLTPEVAEALDELTRRALSLGASAVVAAAAEQLAQPTEMSTPALASRLYGLAGTVRAHGELESACVLLERTVLLLGQVFGPGSAAVSRASGELGEICSQLGEWSDAQEHLEAVLPLREAAPDVADSELGTRRDQLALVLRQLGERAQARELLERALEAWERCPPSTSIAVATADTLRNLALVQWDLGEYAAVRPLAERSLALLEETLGPEHPVIVPTLVNLAIVLKDLGDFDAARPLLARALVIQEQQLGSGHPEVAQTLANLGSLLWEAGAPDQARDVLQRALDIRKQTASPGDPALARSLNDLAFVQLALGQVAPAAAACEQALDIAEASLGPSHPDVASCLESLAAVRRRQGQPARARGLLERALAIREVEFGPGHPRVSSLRNRLAEVLLDTGDLAAAWRHVARGAEGRGAQITSNLPGLTESESFLYLARLEEQLALEISAASLHADPAAEVAAYESLLAWKGQVGRVLVAGRQQLAARRSPEQRALLAELASLQGRLSWLVLRPGKEHPVRTEEVDALQARRADLERELNRSLRPSEAGRDVTLADIVDGLPAGAAAVDFYLCRVYQPSGAAGSSGGGFGEPRVMAWVIRPDREGVVRLDLGDAASFEELTRAFLQDLVVRRGVRMTRTRAGSEESAAQVLLRRLWTPLAPHLEDTERLFVSPDGFLATLPFEVLSPVDGRFLIEDLSIIYVGDLSSLVVPADEVVDEGRDLLSVGGVDFMRGASPAEANSVANTDVRGGLLRMWNRLPATEQESQAVADIHELTLGDTARRTLLQGAVPTEERLKRELPRHDVLHLATHGFFQPEGSLSVWAAAVSGRSAEVAGAAGRRLVGDHPGLLSGVVCAGVHERGKVGGDDGYLTAEEVAWLDLTDAELVVLSACETGLGRAQSGEGLMGLRRAFRMAGARTVISSLWPVRDESTSRLMQSFYGNLWMHGMERHAALRAAQLELLASQRAEQGEAQPSTWGAFVLDGAWR